MAETAQEVDNVVEEYDYESGPKKLLAVFGAVMSVAAIFVLIEFMKTLYKPVQPLADGSFPLYEGSLEVNSLLLIIAGTVLIVMLILSGLHQDGKYALPWGLGAVVFSGLILLIGFNVLNSHGEEVWNKSLKTWASEKYGVEYDHLTQYEDKGIIGRHGSKFEPAVYIELPKSYKFLTAKDGSYVAQLRSDGYKGHSARLYEPSGAENPALIPEFKSAK